MQIYIHERNDETALILSEDGRILSVYPTIDDAWNNIHKDALDHEALLESLTVES